MNVVMSSHGTVELHAWVPNEVVVHRGPEITPSAGENRLFLEKLTGIHSISAMVKWRLYDFHDVPKKSKNVLFLIVSPSFVPVTSGYHIHPKTLDPINSGILHDLMI